MAGEAARWVGLAVGLWVAGSAAAAAAQTVNESRNFSAERFELSLDADGILSAEWDTRVGGGLVLALGLFDWVQLGVEVPFVLYQSRADTIEGVNGRLAPLTGLGVGGPRVAPKVRVLDQERFGVGLAIIPAFVVPSASQGSYMGQDSLLFEPMVALSRVTGAVRLAANLGVRVRRPEAFGNLKVDDELTARLGGGLMLEALGGPPLEVEAVLDAANALGAPFADRNRTHLEGLLGGAYTFMPGLQVFAAAGAGLNQGFGTPDWRALAGLRIFEHEQDEDHDGVRDDEDACPKAPEDLDGFGVLDGADGAPRSPEDMDGFQDQDGVPDPDNDGDGVWDWDDRCPLQLGLTVNLGCPDTDRDQDGLVDRVDRCPDDPEDLDGFGDDDGCPDPDDDQDGLLDAEDRCPRAPGPRDNRGCPDADRDGDGIVDRADNCPDEPGVPEAQGCKTRQLVTIRGERLEILDKVFFDTARARIQPRSFALLKNVAAVLNAHPEIARVEVQGHTDDQGPAQANLRLSQQRAEAVQDFLQKEGVEPGRLVARGYGESEPIAPNATKAGRAENRRVEFLLR